MYKLTKNGVQRLTDGAIIPNDNNNMDWIKYLTWVTDGGMVTPEFTQAELAQQIEDAKPKIVTMRQARLALLQANLLTTVDTAIAAGTDEAMKIEWEYATSIERTWPSLITLATALNMTSTDLDNLFITAASL